MRSFVVSQPSVPCWPSDRLTQFLMPAPSTACSKCWLSKARLLSKISTNLQCIKTGMLRIFAKWSTSSL